MSSAATVTKKDQRLVHAMQALGDNTRFKMFKLLLSDPKLCVSEIANELQISVPAASQHFKTFELLGLVNKQRNGQKICYSINRNDQLVSTLINLVK